MSFSSEQKKIITGAVYKSSCCRAALLCGILFGGAELKDREIILSLEKQEYCELAVRLIKEFYSKEPEPYREKDGGRRILISFESKSAANYISEMQNKGLQLFKNKCSVCLPSFLKGVFLSAGRASDPEKQYSIDFSLGDRSEIFSSFLRELGPESGITSRAGKKSVYIRDSAMIEYFFALAGMNKAMFSLIETKTNKEFRSSIARHINCETNNIQKAINAAAPQLAVIKELEKANLLSSLPEELE